MDSSRAYWPLWKDSLRRQKMDGVAVWLLEAAGPLKVIAAQLLYIGQPLAPLQAGRNIGALAQLLEQEDESQAFTALLKGQLQ
jgi:hypothetical protein